MGEGPDPSGSVNATYTGRSTQPGAAPQFGVLDAKPLHLIDHLDGRTDDELGGPVQSAAHDHRFGARFVGTPGRGSRRRRLPRRLGAAVVAKLIGQGGKQGCAFGTSRAAGAGTAAITATGAVGVRRTAATGPGPRPQSALPAAVRR